MNKYLKVGIAALSGLLFTACGSNGSCSNNNAGGNGDASTLQIITPKIIYSKTAATSSGYVTIINPTNNLVKNLHYNLANQIGGGTLTAIDQATADSCAVMPANSQCNIKLTVAPGAVAGSLGFSTSNDNSGLDKLAQAATSITLPVGVEQAYYNSVSGADGITLSYYHTVIAGVPYIMVSGIVSSDKAGNFNKVMLVDAHNNPLPNQQLISGNVSNSQGSTFSILLPVAAGSSITQTIKVQTQEVTQDDNITVVATANAANTLTTTTAIGITDLLPGAVYLTATNPEQIITFFNSGDSLSQLQSFAATNPNIEVIFNPTTLNSGATVTATLKLKNPALPATSGAVTLSYNNGKEEIKTIAATEQNVSPQPEPTPTPSPAPTTSPSPIPPTPTAGLTAVVTPDNNFFTTTAVGNVTRQLTITNNGSTNENNFVLTLPANFTISAGNSNSCTVTNPSTPATLSDTLVANTGSCTVTVIYNNNQTTSGSANIIINYDYNNGTAAPTPATATVSYQVTQSTANLILMPNSPQTYSSIISNNLAVSSPIGYLLINSGDEEATNLAFNLAGTNPTLFQVIGGTCASGGNLSNLSGSNACTISTQFGPAPNGSAGNKSALFNVGYTPYSGAATTNTTDVLFTGTVTAAPSATFTSSVSANSFISGAGTSASPYTGNTSTGYTLSINYVNTSLSINASGFTTSYSTLPSGWTLTTHGCNNVTMTANGGNCTDVYTLNTTTSGSHDLNLANATASWTDSSDSYSAQAVTGVEIVYTELNTVIPPASLSGTMSSNTFTAGDGSAGNKFAATEGSSPAPTVTYTISNNSTGAANNFYVDWVPPNGWTITTNNCGTSGSPITITGSGNCNMIFELDTTAAAEYELNLSTAITIYWTNTGSAVQQSQALSGRIYAQVVTAPATKMIFVSVTGTTGAMNGLTGADAICQGDGNSGSKTSALGATWKALLRGNNATTVGTTYVTTMNETIATATTSNLIAVGATNGTLLHAIDKTQNGDLVSQLVWTGGKGTAINDTCSNWTNGTGTKTGGYGGSNTTTTWWNYNDQWTPAGYTQPCNTNQSLYCVQQ